MNYFPFHVGDYAAHTAHLEPMEDLAYRRMLDAYYLRETPLPLDVAEVARLIRMKGHQAEVQAVLTEYFQQTPEGWRHGRCDEEIARMQDKQTKARASAAASVNARKANAQRTLNERSTDVELPTPTPTPITSSNEEVDSGPAQRSEPPPPPPPFDGNNAIALNGKSIVSLAATWELPTDWGEDAERLGWKPAEILLQAEKFRQYWTAGKGKGTRRAVKGWRQTWSNWLAKAAENRR